MALTRSNEFDTGTVLTEVKLEGEFDNIYSNALSLISPLTGNLAFGGNRLTGLALGSVGSPALQFTGDTNTGVYSSGADALDLVGGGLRLMTLTSTPSAGVVSIDPAAITATASTNVGRFFVGGTTALTIPAGTTAIAAGLWVAEPNLTATGTITNAATVYIAAAPTEGGTTNNALWVDAGNVLFDANLRAESVGIGVAASGTAGRLTVNENLIVSGAGPHAVGGATVAGVQLGLLGSFTPASGTTTRGLALTSTLTPVAAAGDIVGVYLAPTLAEFSSGVHALETALQVVPTITNAGGTCTTAAGVTIDTFAAATGTTNAAGLYISAAPTAATNNYALWVDAGNVLFDANLRAESMGVGVAASGTAGRLTVNENLILTGGQVAFPATQVASTNANTLDDYEEGTWTPSLTFGTPGDLSVGYDNQAGHYTKIGQLVRLLYRITTNTFTHTTASGACLVNGAPFTAAASIEPSGTLIYQGITHAGSKDISNRIQSNSVTIDILLSQSGAGISQIAAADMPTGGTVSFYGTIVHAV